MIAKPLVGEAAPFRKAGHESVPDPFDAAEQHAAWLDFNFAERQHGTRRRLFDDRALHELHNRAADVVRSFRGEPNRRLSNRNALLWGRKGSFVLNVAGSKRGL